MIGSVRASNPAPPVFFSKPARAPIQLLQRRLEIVGAQPHRQPPALTPIGQLGTRIDLIV